MDLTLRTLSIEPQGAFGYLLNSLGTQIAVTCERTYEVGGKQMVKLPAGDYTCVRGMHTLNRRDWFETFEIAGVPGHAGILFHPGNDELDSEGCVVMGSHFGELWVKDVLMKAVLESRDTFQQFMLFQSGVNLFQLTVEGR